MNGYGLFGGCPSSEEAVYCATDYEAAKDYAIRICGLGRNATFDGAVVTCVPNWNDAIPDEDDINAIVDDDSHPLNHLCWEIFGQQQELGSAEEAKEWVFADDAEAIRDDEWASWMKSIAEQLAKRLPKEQLMQLVVENGAIAFRGPLQVVGVDYFDVGEERKI